MSRLTMAPLPVVPAAPEGRPPARPGAGRGDAGPRFADVLSKHTHPGAVEDVAAQGPPAVAASQTAAADAASPGAAPTNAPVPVAPDVDVAPAIDETLFVPGDLALDHVAPSPGVVSRSSPSVVAVDPAAGVMDADAAPAPATSSELRAGSDDVADVPVPAPAPAGTPAATTPLPDPAPRPLRAPAPGSTPAAASAPALGVAASAVTPPAAVPVAPGGTAMPGTTGTTSAVDAAPAAPDTLAASQAAPGSAPDSSSPAPSAPPPGPGAVAPASGAGTPAPPPAALPPAIPPPTATPPAPSPAQTAPAPPAVPVPPSIPQQLVPRIASVRALGDGVHRLTLRVEPEAIGAVRVVAEVRGDAVRLELFGGTEAAREALRVALPDLRRDLASTGLQAQLDLGTSAERQPGDRNSRSPLGDQPTGPRQDTANRAGPTGSAGHATSGPGRLDVLA